MLTPTNEPGTFGTAARAQRPRAPQMRDAWAAAATSQSALIATARATMRLIG